jgi:dTDP-4-dehydrorhamnose 3,5-epimerase
MPRFRAVGTATAPSAEGPPYRLAPEVAQFSQRDSLAWTIGIVPQQQGISEPLARGKFGGDLIVQPLALPEVKLIVPRVFRDDRGHFSETYNLRRYADAGVDVVFVQDNHSFSARKGTVRGLHFQTPPIAQAKLVSVARGAIFDVAVDIRAGSPTFGKYVSATLSAREGSQIFLPVGFAHGMMTLEPDTEVLYKVSNYYSPSHEISLLWNDPALAIRWPFSVGEPILSPKDVGGLRIADLPPVFEYTGPLT